MTAYYRTGSRKAARKETGVPEPTLSDWLRDPTSVAAARQIREVEPPATESEATVRAPLVRQTVPTAWRPGLPQGPPRWPDRVVVEVPPTREGQIEVGPVLRIFIRASERPYAARVRMHLGTLN